MRIKFMVTLSTEEKKEIKKFIKTILKQNEWLKEEIKKGNILPQVSLKYCDEYYRGLVVFKEMREQQYPRLNLVGTGCMLKSIPPCRDIYRVSVPETYFPYVNEEEAEKYFKVWE